MNPRNLSAFASVLLLLAAAAAQAQTYRWVDEKGRVQFGDSPPASAKGTKPAAGAPSPAAPTAATTASAAPAEQPVPFEVQRLLKDFPVTLYTAPICKQPCEGVRALLNQRGIPFNEVQVWTEDTLNQLKTASRGDNVPALTVGRSAVTGFDTPRINALLDSAGYPAAGSVPARSQAAPPPPEGYQPPPTAEPIKEQESAATAKPGPYDTSKLPSNRVEKPGPYDTSGLKGPPPKQGPYLKPEAVK